MSPEGGDPPIVPAVGGITPGQMTIGDIVSLFLALRGDIQNVEKSIRVSLREEREATTEWFKGHEKSHAERDDEINRQITRLERLVADHIDEADRRWKKEEIKEAVKDGQVRPFLRAVAFVKAEWKWLLIAVLWAFQFVDDLFFQLHQNGWLQ
jgi:hypothetical protein